MSWIEGRPLRLFLAVPVALTVASVVADVLTTLLHGVAFWSYGFTFTISFEVGTIVLASWAYWSSLVRLVGLTNQGVTFVRGSASYIQTSWESLCPPEWPARFHAVTFFYKLWEPDPKSTYQNYTGPRPGPPVMVDIRQAQAILSHPNCPKWDLKPEIRKSLGLPPD